MGWYPYRVEVYSGPRNLMSRLIALSFHDTKIKAQNRAREAWQGYRIRIVDAVTGNQVGKHER